MGNELIRTPEGHLLIPKELQGKMADAPLGSLHVTPFADDLLVRGYLHPGERGRPLFYGDLRLFHVGELMALVSTMHKDGYLTIMVPHAKKTVYFSRGEIVFASSSVEDDRLGEILWRQGYIPLEKLSEVHDLVSPKKKLGAVLVDRGLLTPRLLYEGIKEQVLEIVFSTFHFRKGEFLFAEGKVGMRGIVRLDTPTRDVIMEGIRRLEEMSRLEEQFADREMALFRRPVVVDAALGETERNLLRLVDGKRSVQSVIAESHLGEFEVFKALGKLHRLGLIDVRERAVEEKKEEGPLRKLLEEYASLMQHIFQTLQQQHPGSQSRLEAYLGSPPKRYRRIFLNVGFDSAGLLDMDTVFRNAKEFASTDARKLALEALSSFYDYGVFQALDLLSEEESEPLLGRLRAIRSMINAAKTGGEE